MSFRFAANLRSARLCFCAIVVCCTVSPHSAVAATWGFIPAEARSTTAPIPLILIIPQTTLEGGKDPGGAAPFGLATSLLGGLVVSAMNSIDASMRHHKAVEAVGPLLPGLDDFDANAVLTDDFKTALSRLGWARLANDTRVPESAISSAQIAGAPIVAKATCAYLMPGDIDSIFAYCEVNAFYLTSAQGTLTDANKVEGKLFFSRRIEVQVGMSKYGPDNNARKTQWLTNSGAALKRALTIAMSNVAELSVKALSQKPTDYDVYRKINNNQYLDMHGGKLVEGGENLINSHESCFNRKNKSSIKVDSAGTTTQEADGSFYRCVGFTSP